MNTPKTTLDKSKEDVNSMFSEFIETCHSLLRDERELSITLDKEIVDILNTQTSRFWKFVEGEATLCRGNYGLQVITSGAVLEIFDIRDRFAPKDIIYGVGVKSTHGRSPLFRTDCLTKDQNDPDRNTLSIDELEKVLTNIIKAAKKDETSTEKDLADNLG